MSQVAWIRGPVCGIDNCRSRLYMRNAGRKFCQFGHVAEGDLDIEDEDGESYSQTKRLNISLTDTGFGSQATSTVAAAESISRGKGKQRYYGQEGIDFSYKCLQYVLRKVTPQAVRYLHRNMGEPAVESLMVAVNPLVKLLWMRCVKYSYKMGMPNVTDLYILIYLALRQINRYPVFVDEFLYMLSRNKVPYLEVYRSLPAEMRALLPNPSMPLFTTAKVPLDDIFYRLVAKWSNVLKLYSLCDTPIDYSYPIVFKLLTDLRIPHAPHLLMVYHELASKLTEGVFKQQGAASFITTTEAQIVGLAHYVIRLYLLASPEIFDTKQWTEWLSQDDELPCFNNRIHHMTTDQIIGFSNEQVSKYLNWVYDHLVPGKYRDPEGDGLSVMEKKLDKIFTFVRSNQETKSSHSSTPFGIVKNNLSPSDLADVEAHLDSFLCTKFGLKRTTLQILRERVDNSVHAKFRYKRFFFADDA